MGYIAAYLLLVPVACLAVLMASHSFQAVESQAAGGGGTALTALDGFALVGFSIVVLVVLAVTGRLKKGN